MARKPKGQDASAGAIDAHVGARLRAQRTLLKISQKKLARSIGITFQQIQKYESGENRISSSRLFQLSQVLSVPISFFFEDMPAKTEAAVQKELSEKALEPLNKEQPDNSDVLIRYETLKLVRAYYQIHDAKQRRKIHELIRSLSNTPLQ